MEDERVYELNCVHSLSLILWEILTDSVPFGSSTTYRASEIVCEGGMPDIEVLKGIDEPLYHIISTSLNTHGNNNRYGVGFDQFHSLLIECGGGVSDENGNRTMDETLPPDTAVIALPDVSEVVEE